MMATIAVTSNPISVLTNGLDVPNLVELIRIAETAERYEDMLKWVTQLVQLKSANQQDLDVNERNLLSVACKNIIGAKRASWRSLASPIDNTIKKYKSIIENEIETICLEIINLVSSNLCPIVSNNADETEVFYLKMLGDYYRYLCELRMNNINYKNHSLSYYQKAMNIAEINLNETHPTRLGLALNFSVFYKEIMNEPDKAANLAKFAFDSSIQKLDTLNDSSYKDSTLIMQLLRDNLTEWCADDNDNDDDGTIGLTVGGSKDVNNFRECINNNIMPSIGSITYNGLLYEYYFNTKNKLKKQILNDNNDDNKQKDDGSHLFYPSYCYAQINKPDFNDKDDNKANGDDDDYEYYMSVGLNSNIKASDFKRKALNLVIVLDKSGSMRDCFDSERTEYFQQFDNVNSKKTKTKMEIARESVVSLLKHLTSSDRFGFIVFDDEAVIKQKLSLISDIDMNVLKQMILDTQAGGGTNFEIGYNKAIELYSSIGNDSKYDNRIIFLTDAQPTAGVTDPNSLLYLVDKNARNKFKHIYTSFIGVGLDFNSNLIEIISNTRGCNYYSVLSTESFINIMDNDFEYMVSPLVFNVCLTLKPEGNACFIDKVYGSSTKNEENIIKNGEITKINTLFPSKKSSKKGGTKGGIQLIKLKKNQNIKNVNNKFNVEICVKFEDKYGKIYKNVQYVTFKDNSNTNNNANDMLVNDDYFDNNGIRKGILLCKYIQLLINWIKYEKNIDKYNKILNVSNKYKKIFSKFIVYFEKEMKECNDNELKKELNILTKLKNL